MTLSKNISHRIRKDGKLSRVIMYGVLLSLLPHTLSSAMNFIQLSKDKCCFIREIDLTRFIPWGFNYDHDENGRLLEDYWEKEWQKVEEDFQEMKDLGANVVRIHLQLGKFMKKHDKPNAFALDKLAPLVELAERAG